MVSGFEVLKQKKEQEKHNEKKSDLTGFQVDFDMIRRMLVYLRHNMLIGVLPVRALSFPSRFL